MLQRAMAQYPLRRGEDSRLLFKQFTIVNMLTQKQKAREKLHGSGKAVNKPWKPGQRMWNKCAAQAACKQWAGSAQATRRQRAHATQADNAGRLCVHRAGRMCASC